MSNQTDIAMTQIMEDIETSGQQERDHSRLTASGINPPCPRQTAYRLQGVAPTNPEHSNKPGAQTVGTMLHERYADWWRADPDALVEITGPHGTPDVVRVTPPAEDRASIVYEVRDLKTVNRTKFDRWVSEDGPADEVWDQLAIYANGAKMLTGGSLVIDALCRDTGRAATYVVKFTQQWGEELVQRLQQQEQDWSTTEPGDVATNGRTGRGDWLCDGCPWADLCLGVDDRPAPAQWTDEAISDAAREYSNAKQDERAAKARASKARETLEGVDGEVGEFVVRWTKRDMPERMVKASTQTVLRVTRKQVDR